jgi:sigma-B regulation protein RsbU (phosphoserine phosphatase)
MATGVVFVVSFVLFFVSARQAIIDESFAHAESKLERTTDMIETLLTQAEQSVRHTAMFIEQALNTPDKFFVILDNALQSTSIIGGVCVAFEPYYFQEKGRSFAPYVHRENDSIMTTHLTYNYFEKEWYAKTKLLQQENWSEPYFGEAGHFLMVSCSRPLIDAQGKFYGIITADLVLDSVANLVAATKPYDSAYTFLLDSKGYYLSHRREERILKENIFTIPDNQKDTTIAHIGREMTAGQRGRIEFINDDEFSYVFYAPIPVTKWSVATVVPQRDILKELHNMTWKVILIALLGMVALLFFALLIIRKVAAPLRLFSQSVRTVAEGNFDAPLPAITSKDELEELHNSFKFMQVSLKKHIKELKEVTSKKQQIESELQIARTIQMGMLPKTFPAFPKRNDIDLYAVLTPAKEVGGDLYDFVVHEEKLYFIIGDVSGKGIPASLLMAVTRSLFRSAVYYLPNPVDIVKSISNSLEETNDAGMFVTLFVGVLDLHTGHCAYCNAGHNPPAVVDAAGHVTFMEVKPNIPAGVFEKYEYTGGEHRFNYNDTIFLYTDGLTEAQNPSLELYGETRLVQALEANAGKAPKELTQQIAAAVARHVKEAEPSDDLTILTITYKAGQHKKTLTVANRLSDMQTVTALLKQLGEQWSIPQKALMQLQLAVEEAVVNIISYAYPEKETGLIDISFERNDNRITVEIADGGKPFDPTATPPPDITLSAEERPVGGLGIFLVKNIMDEVAYRREEKKNILTMSYKL